MVQGYNCGKTGECSGYMPESAEAAAYVLGWGVLLILLYFGRGAADLISW